MSFALATSPNPVMSSYLAQRQVTLAQSGDHRATPGADLTNKIGKAQQLGIKDFKSGAIYPPLFNVNLNGKQELHQGRIGLATMTNGIKILAVSVQTKNGPVYVLMPQTGSKNQLQKHSLSEFSKAIAANLSQLQADGKLVIDSSSYFGPSNTPELRQQSNENLANIAQGIILLANVGFLASAALQLYKAATLARTLWAAQKAGTITAQQIGQLKAAEATLVGFAVGATAGGTSYTVFVKEKYFDEAFAGIAAGKPVDAMSNGAKASIQLLNWTLGAGKTSTDLGLFNVGIGKKIMEASLKGAIPKGWNWGFFVDLKAWTRPELIRVFGEKVGIELTTKYSKIITWMSHPDNRNKLLDASGKLAVPQSVIDAAKIPGVTDTASLVKSLVDSGMWRVFTVKPILGSPLVLASAGSASRTANAYFQLMARGALTGMGINAFWQTVSGLSLKGEVNPNWIQLLGSGVSGPFRALGAPGAWAAGFAGRLGSYGISSTAAWGIQQGWKTVAEWVQAKSKAGIQTKDEKFSTTGLAVLSRANSALNSSAILLKGLDSNFGSLADKKFVAEYINKLDVLMRTPANQLETKAAELDAWLAGNNGEGKSRREKLNGFKLGWVPDLHSATAGGFFTGQISGGKFTGSFIDLAIAPSFAKKATFAEQD
jgi:hypothetical protein